jgi:hypothetical protein
MGAQMNDIIEAGPSFEMQRDFLADAMRKALRHLDQVDLDAYFREATSEHPSPWVKVLMAMQDELRPALNILGLNQDACPPIEPKP